MKRYDSTCMMTRRIYACQDIPATMFERLDAAPSLSDRVAQTLMDKIDAGELRRG